MFPRKPNPWRWCLQFFRSVYPGQILAVAKSASLKPDMGKTVEEMQEVTVTSRDESVVRLGKKVMRTLRRKTRK